jgi:uncharacterized protein YrzB (UPF0473 family)
MKGVLLMDEYGSDFITITDEDGVEYELEILSRLEYRGKTYLAVIPAVSSEEEDEEEELEVSLLRSDEEDGEPLLCAITDEKELEAVYELMMQQLYEEDEEED